MQSASQAIVTFNQNEAYWFNHSGGSYQAQFGAKQTLVDDTSNGLLVFTDTDGTVYEFYDSATGARRGRRVLPVDRAERRESARRLVGGTAHRGRLRKPGPRQSYTI